MTQDAIISRLFDIKQALYFKQDRSLGRREDGDLLGVVPAISPRDFGSPDFRQTFGLRYAYVGGAMVGGISSPAMVKALAEGGALGIYGASGNAPAVVEETVAALKKDLGERAFGACLINTPHDPDLEEKVTEIYLQRGVRLIEASAFMQLSPSLVRYRLTGIHETPDGAVVTPNQIMAKVSRVELARRFFAPPPEKLVNECLRRGWITPAEAALAPRAPMARFLTAEADSGGHTDFRPAVCLWPAMARTAREFSAKYGYTVYAGAAGGLGTPWAVLAAQAAGAAYFVTGSINQSCLESGLSAAGRELLAKAGPADMAAGPAADMFELGAKVQVLRFGTLYAMRAQKLADAYRQYGALEELPAEERETLETQIFKAPLEDIWGQTRAFFQQRDPAVLEKAKDPKFKMALVFRWYLGQASRWAINGLEDRRADWQIFCGPAMGAFNEWAKGTEYEKPENRRVVDLAMNLLYGAAVLKRFDLAGLLGVLPPGQQADLKPLALSAMAPYL